MHVKSQWCLTLYNPMDCSPPGSSVHGDSQGKNTGAELPCPLPGGSSQTRDGTCVSCGSNRNLIQICVQSDIVLRAEFKPFNSINELPLSKGILW